MTPDNPTPPPSAPKPAPVLPWMVEAVKKLKESYQVGWQPDDHRDSVILPDFEYATDVQIAEFIAAAYARRPVDPTPLLSRIEKCFHMYGQMTGDMCALRAAVSKVVEGDRTAKKVQRCGAVSLFFPT